MGSAHPEASRALPSQVSRGPNSQHVTLPLNSFPPEPAISAVRSDSTRSAICEGSPQETLQPGWVLGSPHSTLVGWERAEKRNQQEGGGGPGPPAASGSLAECMHQTGNPSVEGRTPAPPSSTPAESDTKGPDRDMNESLASYPAPGPHSRPRYACHGRCILRAFSTLQVSAHSI